MLCCVEAAWFSDSIIHTLLLWQTLQEYFKYVSSMNQVASLCRQIQSDVTSGQHKYMAHQIALLYQSLGALGKPAVEVRKEIEANFARVKGTTEGSKVPTLPEEIQRWLLAKTRDVLAVVTVASPLVREQLRPVTRLLSF